MHVSVVIPVRNASAYIITCLQQLKKQDYPQKNIDIIVVDGASDDSTVELARSFDPGEMGYQVLALKETGRSQGLNAGLKAAWGDAICRLDARTRIPSDYLTQCVAALTRTGAANVGGLQLPEGTTTIQQAIGLAMAHPFGVGNAQFRIGKKSGFVDTVYLGFFRRDIFDKVGYFDEGATVISEDSDMNQRIREAGEKVFLDVKIYSHYVPRETLADQFRLYYRYGGARAANVLKHRRFTSMRQLVAPIFIACLLLSGCLAPFSPIAMLIFIFVCGTYLLADIVVSFILSARNHNWTVLWPLLCAFPTMHVAWGTGFWKKLIVPENPQRQWKG